MKIKRPPTICTRCNKKKWYKSFLERTKKYKTICKPCLTKEEWYDHFRPDISKDMDGLEIREKQMILRQIVREHKKNMELKNAQKTA